MTDQAIINLKKKLDALSSKSPKGKVITKEENLKQQSPQPSIKPLQPLPTQKRSVLGELSPEEIRDLKAQLGYPEQKETPQEMEEEVEEDDEEEYEEPAQAEPSSEDLEQLRKIQAEIERLQNAGAFRVEVLYQYLGINANLNRIATALEKLINGKK